ncbi:Adrenodoxin-like protein, mitochondrial [Acromyrmex echinatior]|uniref:Adrenodoxin-like protein, mitochondrial n=1 Tax=Acromyrmex echinatior TaxID=103372 RepID=F4WA94_ACREC|nr:Adrenodoxin-like protein, mitochondrial [Acromyrmex echinatior]
MATNPANWRHSLYIHSTMHVPRTSSQGQNKNIGGGFGCQIILKKELDGIELELPKATRNFYVDGHTPTSH